MLADKTRLIGACPPNSPHAFEQGRAAVIVINSDGTAVTKLMILSQAQEPV